MSSARRSTAAAMDDDDDSASAIPVFKKKKPAGGSAATSSSSSAAAATAKKPATRVSSSLSFDDDAGGEEDAFTAMPKLKSAASASSSSAAKPASKANPFLQQMAADRAASQAASTPSYAYGQRSRAGEYTSEKLAALRGNAMSLKTATADSAASTAAASASESTSGYRGDTKVMPSNSRADSLLASTSYRMNDAPTSSAATTIATTTSASTSAAALRSTMPSLLDPSYSTALGRETMSNSAGSGSAAPASSLRGDEDDDRRAGDIARRKRERARQGQGGAGADYISLSSGGNTAASSTAVTVANSGAPATTTILGREYAITDDKSASGLVADDLEDDDVDDVDESSGNRLTMGASLKKGTDKRARGKRGGGTGGGAKQATSKAMTAADGTILTGDDATGDDAVVGANGAEDDMEEDDELAQYEMEKMRRGGAKQSQQQKANAEKLFKPPPARRAYAPLPPSASSAAAAGAAHYSALSVDSIKRSLVTAVGSLKENRERHSRELTAKQQEIAFTRKLIEERNAERDVLANQYDFYRSVRQEVSDVLEMLSEKAPLIEEASDELRELRTAHHAALEAVRTTRELDERYEAFGIASLPSTKSDSKSDPVPTSPLDTPADRDRRLADRLKRRIQRKTRLRGDARMAIVTATTAAGDSDGSAARKYSPLKLSEEKAEFDLDGWLTDDDDDQSVNANYEQQRSSLVAEADRLLDDVDESFQTFDSITERLSQWKQRYLAAYTDAYISLSVPGLVAPYVRLELMRWLPLAADDSIPAGSNVITRLAKLKWYEKLFNFGVVDANAEPYVLIGRARSRRSSSSSRCSSTSSSCADCRWFPLYCSAADDADNLLVPKLVEKVVTPILNEHIKLVFDPYSSAQQQRAIAAVQDVITHIVDHPPGSGSGTRAVSSVCTAVVTRLTNAVNAHAKLQRVPMMKLPVAAAAAAIAAAAATGGSGAQWHASQWAYCRRRWWRAIKLCTHIVQWAAAIQSLQSTAPAGTADAPSTLIALAVTHINESILPFASLAIASAPAGDSVTSTLRWLWLQLLVFTRGSTPEEAKAMCDEWLPLLHMAGVAGSATPFGSAEQTTQQQTLAKVSKKIAAAIKLSRSVPPPPPPPASSSSSSAASAATAAVAAPPGAPSSAAAAFAAASNASAASKFKSELRSSSSSTLSNSLRDERNGNQPHTKKLKSEVMEIDART